MIPLVGRDVELRTALDAVADAQDGSGKLVVVHGETGIGKSRLCHEMRSLQDRDRVQVLTGRAGPGDAEIVYSVLADSLRGARRSEPELWAAAARRTRVLAEVVPELAPEGSVSGTLLDRPVVFETLLDVVEEAAIDRATLWVVEDLHWADPATWEFVAYAARRVGDMSLTLAVTFRDEKISTGRWSRLLALERDPDVIFVGLDRLDAVESSAMIRAIDPALSSEVVDRVVVRSAGNPLLIGELLATVDPSHSMPDIVMAAVREQVARLSPADLAVLEAAAVLGPRVDVGLLLEIAVVDADRADEQLAGGGFLVAAEEGDSETIVFWHPLVWEAIYNDITLPRRRQLHASIAGVLEGHDLQPESAARHYELAEDPQAALATLLMAHKAAEGNVGRSASLARAALELARRHEELRDRQDELVHQAIDSLADADRWTEVEPLVNDLWPTRHVMTPQQRAWLAAVHVQCLRNLGQLASAHMVAEAEITHLETVGEVAEAGPLLVEAAFVAYCLGDFAAALRHAAHGSEIATASGDVATHTRASVELTRARRHTDIGRSEALAQFRAAADAARTAGSREVHDHALFAVARTSLDPEDFAVAEQVATGAGTVFALLDQVLLGLLHLLEGRPDPAEALLARAGPGVCTSIPLLATFVSAASAQLFLHRGELDHARQLLESTPLDSDAAGDVPLVRATLAGVHGWLAWEEDGLDEAASILDLSLRSCLSGGGYDFLDTGPLLLPLQVDALMHLDRPADAQRAVDLCVDAHPEPDRFFAASLAAARFRLAGSEETAIIADGAATNAPWPWLQALVIYWRGDLLSDLDAAEEARERFEAIGALRMAGRAETQLRRLGKRIVGRDTDGAGELSPRELEVAKLVAEGLTNSAIAARLFVSRATVSSHVTHILAKLGFSSRTQVAAWIATRNDR